MVLNPWICYFYIYYDYFIVEIFLELMTIEAVFHYLFIRKQSESIYLVIKEDLLSRIILRIVVVVGFSNTWYKFHKLNRMPKPYNVCAGTEPLSASKECDMHQDQYNVLTTMLYILVYSVFSILLLVEKRKIKTTHTTTINDHLGHDASTLHTPISMRGSFETVMNTERVLLFTKVIYATQLLLLTGVYDQYDASLIQEYPGVLLLYWYHFFMVPLAVLFGIGISLKRNEGLNRYMKRKLWGFKASMIDPVL